MLKENYIVILRNQQMCCTKEEVVVVVQAYSSSYSRLRQEDFTFEACLDYRVSSKLVWASPINQARYSQIVALMSRKQPTAV